MSLIQYCSSEADEQRYQAHGQDLCQCMLDPLKSLRITADKQDVVELGAELASDVTGRRSLLYPILPTSTKHYIPSTLSSLATSAEIAREAGTSKKDPATRRKELLDYASPGLLEMIATKGEEMVRDPGSGLVVQEVMLLTIGGESTRLQSSTGLTNR